MECFSDNIWAQEYMELLYIYSVCEKCEFLHYNQHCYYYGVINVITVIYDISIIL